MTTNKQWTFIESMADPEYRRAFADEMIGTGLAFQLRRLREAKYWTQEYVAQQTGKAQETISQWENPNYGRYSLSTLKRLAAAFDVALLVRFIPFSELADWTIDVRPNRLTPPSFDEERQLSFAQIPGTFRWTTEEDSIPSGNTVMDTPATSTAMAFSPKSQHALGTGTGMGSVIVSEPPYNLRIVERERGKTLAAA